MTEARLRDQICRLGSSLFERGLTSAKLYRLLRGLNPRYLTPAQVGDLIATFGLTVPGHLDEHDATST